MAAKLRVRYGDLEIECEGEPSFIKSEVPQIVEAITKLLQSTGVAAATKAAGAAGLSKPINTGGGASTTTKALALSKGVKKGPDLLKIALAYLHSVEGKERATRADILKEMKTVSSVFKPSMEANFPRTVTQLMADGELNEPSKGSYVLSDAAKKEIMG